MGLAYNLMRHPWTLPGRHLVPEHRPKAQMVFMVVDEASRIRLEWELTDGQEAGNVSEQHPRINLECKFLKLHSLLTISQPQRIRLHVIINNRKGRSERDSFCVAGEPTDGRQTPCAPRRNGGSLWKLEGGQLNRYIRHGLWSLLLLRMTVVGLSACRGPDFTHAVGPAL